MYIWKVADGTRTRFPIEFLYDPKVQGILGCANKA